MKDLFAKDANQADFTNFEWSIRMNYLRELMEAKSRGGCSKCARSRIQAKYRDIHRAYMARKKEAVPEGH